MKSIELKTTKVNVSKGNTTKEVDFNYKDIILEIVNNVPEQGLTTGGIRDRVKLIDSIEKAKDTLLIEDADHKILADLVKKYSWAVVSPAIIEFEDAIMQAEEVNPNANDKGTSND